MAANELPGRNASSGRNAPVASTASSARNAAPGPSGQGRIGAPVPTKCEVRALQWLAERAPTRAVPATKPSVLAPRPLALATMPWGLATMHVALARNVRCHRRTDRWSHRVALLWGLRATGGRQ